MKNRIVFMLMLMTVFNIMAQESVSGQIEKRSTKPFHHINIAGEMKVKLVHSDEPLVIVDGNPYQIRNTITMLREDTLFVYQTNVRKSDGRVKVEIYADDIVMLDVNGKTTVDASGFNMDFLGVRIKEGAEVKLKSTVKDKSVAQKDRSFNDAAYYAKWTPVSQGSIE